MELDDILPSLLVGDGWLAALAAVRLLVLVLRREGLTTAAAPEVGLALPSPPVALAAAVLVAFLALAILVRAVRTRISDGAGFSGCLSRRPAAWSAINARASS